VGDRSVICCQRKSGQTPAFPRLLARPASVYWPRAEAAGQVARVRPPVGEYLEIRARRPPRTRTDRLVCQGGVVARINDVGGVEGFDLPQPELDEPAFHADWEAHVFAMNRALLGAGVYNLDEFRDAIERMPPGEYLASGYYEKWFHAVTTLCVEKGVLSNDEVHGG